MQESLYTDTIHMAHSNDSAGLDAYALHCHVHYEVYYFISGNVRYLVEGRHYAPAPHSVLFLPSNAFHGVRVEGRRTYERYAFHFLPELVPEDLREQLLAPFHKGGGYFCNISQYRIDWYMDSLLECNHMQKEIRDSAIQARGIALLTQLYALSAHTSRNAPAEYPERFSIQEIITYLNEHITEELSLRSICERFYISPNHVNRLFRQATGTTVCSYINYKRVTLARQLMRRDYSAADAAVNVGFRDYSTFFRTYKKLLGDSPSGRRHSRESPGQEFEKGPGALANELI